MAHNVQVQNTFSGPLDLLLYLVRRDEIEIHDIPVAHLTREYLAEIKRLDLVDVDAGGEFIAMAAMLVELKSRWLLPPTVALNGEEEEEPLIDPRQGLVQALLEYKQFKQATGELRTLAEQHQARFARRAPPPDFATVKPIDGGEKFSALDLFAAFQRMMHKLLAHQRRREIVNVEVPTEVRIRQIENVLAECSATTFTALLSDEPTRDEMVGFFIAILELIRLRKITARQAADFSEIHLQKIDAVVDGEVVTNIIANHELPIRGSSLLSLANIFRQPRKISNPPPINPPRYELFPRQQTAKYSPRYKSFLNKFSFPSTSFQR